MVESSVINNNTLEIDKKEQQRQRMKEYYINNKEKIKEQNKKYHDEHQEQYKQYKKNITPPIRKSIKIYGMLIMKKSQDDPNYKPELFKNAIKKIK